MQEIIAQVLVILQAAWRYRWPAVVAAWIVALAGWVAVQVLPDKYQSSTRVYVDTESLLRPLLTGIAVDRDVMTQVGMMQTVMLSRPNLEKVAQKTDLMLSATTRKDQEAVVDSLAKNVTLGRPTTGRVSQNTFEVSFEDSDPRTANRVVAALLDTFMEDSLGLKRSDAAQAQRFLESQLKDYEKKLSDAETRLATFKQQNVGVMPDTGNTYYQQLEAANSQMQDLRQTYTEMQSRRDELARQLQGEEPTFGLMGSTEGNPIDGQIARFKAQRDQLLLQYTEKHPQVQALNQTIARLEEEKRKGAKISSTVAAPGADVSGDQGLVRSLDVNPVYQNLRLQLSTADADLASLRGQMSAQQSVISRLRSRVEAVPEVEAELARLNRDYEVNKRQYDTLLERLEAAKISRQADQSSDNVKFRVIDPPTMPFKPSGPNRVLLNSFVLLLALGAGVGVAVLLAQLHPTFSTREILQKVTGVPVLGSIALAIREQTPPWYRRQSALVGGAVSLLLFVFILNVALTEPIRAALRAAAG
jgi:polysaccharide chain length determinant protein (PEP-CTERM system associated)